MELSLNFMIESWVVAAVAGSLLLMVMAWGFFNKFKF